MINLASSGDIEPGRPVLAVGRRLLRLAVLGVLALVSGIALLIVATAVLNGVNEFLRVAIALLSLILIYQGVDRTTRFFLGDYFETVVWLSVIWLGLVILGAITANWLPLSESRDPSKALTAPILQGPNLFSSHPLGTDHQGLDLLGGLLFGARVSLIVSFGAAAIGTVVGSGIGLMAGYFRGKFEAVVNLLTDSLLAFPPLVLLLAMAATLGPSVRNITIALGLVGIPTYIRLSRANTIAVAQREYVLAAKALGARRGRIIVRELLPNVALPVVSYGLIVIGALIVAEASLSFLGLSVQRPTPTWGNMIAAGQPDLFSHPHLVFVPGAVLFLTVFSLNRVGDYVRKRWDPRGSRI